MWDANTVEVAALLHKDGRQIESLSLQFAGTPSQFAGTWEIAEAGVYQATVYAYDPSNGNTGLDSVTFVVLP